MNNFEKRLLLNYLEKLINHIDYRSYNFDELFEAVLKEFKIKRTKFKFDDDGAVLTETIKQRTELKRKLKSIVDELISKLPVLNTKLEERFLLIKDIYHLEENEYQSFVFLMMQEINSTFDNLDNALTSCGFENFTRNFLKVRYSEKERITNILYLNKLTINKSSHPSINQDLVRIFDDPKCNNADKIIAALLGKSEKSNLTLKDYTHLKKECSKTINILKSAIEQKAKGVNILFYGAVGVGKTELSALIANTISVPIYAVKTENENGSEARRADRLADLYSKQQILSRSGKGCILFDEMEDVTRGFSDLGGASKGYLNKIIESTPVPVIWITNNITDADPAFLRRMTYAVAFNELSEQTRLNIWNKAIKKNGLKVSKAKVEELNKNYNVSPSIIANAVKTTKMINGNENDFEDLIESVAKVVQKKSDVKEKKEEKSELGSYDISLVNADMDMADLTDKIKQSGKMNFSLCLFGISGSGKSRYVLHLAEQLGIKAILKKVSDIQSCYVGECEKNIAAMFKQAEEQNAMLILDEADSFLQDRTNAVRSWELSQVNQLLVELENTKIPFAATTNLMDTLDQASLRRFTFKVGFSYMSKEQTKRAFKHFFNSNSAFYIKGLCCGDFANIKKKADFMNITDINTITKMLKEEVNLKKLPELNKNKIGF